MTKDGFSFPVMAYRGVKAARFEELILNEQIYPEPIT